MNRFRHAAEDTIARDAGTAAFAGAIVMLALSYSPPVALTGGGTLALVFSLFLIWRAVRLTEEQVPQLEAWRQLDPRQRTAGRRRWARNSFAELLLRKAKSAAAAAIGCFGAALISRIV